MKKKGFTLIELLAVIVILGIVMAIAIPGINMVINNTRKNSFVREAQLFVNAARNKVRAEEVKIPNNPNEVTIISVNALEMDKGGKTSSFNLPWNYNKSYVLIHNEGQNGEQKLVYYIALADEADNGLNLTNVEENLEIVDGETSITNIGYEYLPGSPTGTTTTGMFSFYPINGITTAHVYIGETSGEGGQSEEPGVVVYEDNEVKYIIKNSSIVEDMCEINWLPYTHLIDKRNAQEYPAVKVTSPWSGGSSCWMGKNLSYAPDSCLNATWDTTAPHNACRKNSGSGWDKDEVLYQFEIADSICPTGWQIPDEDGFQILNENIKETEKINYFMDVFPGFRTPENVLSKVNEEVSWWGVPNWMGGDHITKVYYDSQSGMIDMVGAHESSGLSVRCTMLPPLR